MPSLKINEVEIQIGIDVYINKHTYENRIAFKISNLEEKSKVRNTIQMFLLFSTLLYPQHLYYT